jgi:heme o synthase
LFSILYFWQLPHFLAISWRYRHDYAAAGYKMLSTADSTGKKVSRYILFFTIIVVSVSFIPSIIGLKGILYAVGVLILSAALMGNAARMFKERSEPAARKLFHTSLVFLPALFTLLVLT